MTPIKCMLCNKSDHIASTCPDLHDPLKEGFYSGAVQDQHNHEEEENPIFNKVNTNVLSVS